MRFLVTVATKGFARRVAWWGGAALMATSMSAFSATTIDVWHALNPHNAQVFEQLVKRFNRESDQTRVRLKAFDGPQAIDAALEKAKKESDRPNLVQLDEARLPDVNAKRDYIMPLHQLLAKHPMKGVEWFLPAENTAARDSKGRLVAFPYMLDIPVMFYNIDAFSKAGINPPEPQRVWSGLQSQVVTVANNGSRQCPLTSDQTVSVNLESLAAVNNQPFTAAQNPRAGRGAPVFHFDSLYIRHLSLMISWVRSELMVRPELNNMATQRFANGECAVLLSQSSNLGWFGAQRGLTFGVTGLPYYPEVTSAPGLPFVGGAALWATRGHSAEHDAATAEFLAWLAKADNAATWFEETGYLPLTREAFEKAKKRGSVYEQWHALVTPYEKEPVATARGFQIKNYPEIRAIFHQSLQRALSGDEPAVTVLRAASDQASKIAK